MKSKANKAAKKEVATKTAITTGTLNVKGSSPDELSAKVASDKILKKAAAAGVIHPTAKATSTKLLKQAAANGGDKTGAKKLLK